MEDNAVPPLEGKPSFDSPRKSVSTSPLPSQEDRLKYFRTKLENPEGPKWLCQQAEELGESAPEDLTDLETWSAPI